MTTLPLESRTRAAALYAAGSSIRQVAAELGVTYTQARGVLLAAGAVLRRQGRSRTTPTTASTASAPAAARRRRPFDLARAARLYLSGCTLNEVAARTGYSRSRVHVLLREAGVPMRTAHHPRASRISAAKRRQILAAWKAQRTNAQIIAEAQTSSATIRKVVQEAGLPPRRPHRKYDHDRMKKLRAEGKMLTEIAADQGTSPQYVWNIVNGSYLRSYVKRGRPRTHTPAAAADAT
ncbi:helix-turn-helix domain-containing protein [Planomonospora algeriensis]